MIVRFLPPLELDATVKHEADGALNITPRFFTPKGPTTLGAFVTYADDQRMLDRVQINVNGAGRLSISHRMASVKAVADGGDAEAVEKETGDE